MTEPFRVALSAGFRTPEGTLTYPSFDLSSLQVAIHAETNGNFLLVALEVNVASAALDRLHEASFEEANRLGVNCAALIQEHGRRATQFTRL